MRFLKEKKLIEAYYNNSTKWEQKFLWWPLTIDGETRWLETAYILYRVRQSEDLFCNKYYYWSPIEFTNK